MGPALVPLDLTQGVAEPHRQFVWNPTFKSGSVAAPTDSSTKISSTFKHASCQQNRLYLRKNIWHLPPFRTYKQATSPGL